MTDSKIYIEISLEGGEKTMRDAFVGPNFDIWDFAAMALHGKVKDFRLSEIVEVMQKLHDKDVSVKVWGNPYVGTP